MSFCIGTKSYNKIFLALWNMPGFVLCHTSSELVSLCPVLSGPTLFPKFDFELKWPWLWAKGHNTAATCTNLWKNSFERINDESLSNLLPRLGRMKLLSLVCFCLLMESAMGVLETDQFPCCVLMGCVAKAKKIWSVEKKIPWIICWSAEISMCLQWLQFSKDEWAMTSVMFLPLASATAEQREKNFQKIWGILQL